MIIPENRDGRAAFRLYADRVRAAATGRWPSLLIELGVPEAALRNRHGACPGCGGRDRFRFDDLEGRGTWICSRGGDGELAGDGFALLDHAFGVGFTEAVRRVGALLNIDDPTRRVRVLAPLTKPVAPPKATADRCGDPDRARRAVAVVLRESRVPSANGPVARYLAARGLAAIQDDWPNDIRECSALRYYEGDGTWTEHPALAAILRSIDGELVTLHRIYLTNEGRKASVATPKRLMTPISPTWFGAAVRLYAADDRLALAEGIESALAVRIATGWPVWATVTAGGLSAVSLPAGIRRVAIHADHDDAGRRAAEQARERMERLSGAEVSIVLPPLPGMDPLDALLAQRGAA